jgi:hypothetical protein
MLLSEGDDIERRIHHKNKENTFKLDLPLECDEGVEKTHRRLIEWFVVLQTPQSAGVRSFRGPTGQQADMGAIAARTIRQKKNKCMRYLDYVPQSLTLSLPQLLKNTK